MGIQYVRKGAADRRFAKQGSAVTFGQQTYLGERASMGERSQFVPLPTLVVVYSPNAAGPVAANDGKRGAAARQVGRGA